MNLFKLPYWIKRQPFSIDANLNYSLILNFALPYQRLQKILPAGLNADIHDNYWGFVAMTVTQIQQIYPQSFPAFSVYNSFHISYRILVSYQGQAGKKLRGSYILRSETDKRSIEWLGNILTPYNFSKTDIQQKTERETMEISSQQSNFKILISSAKTGAPLLPPDSVFDNWESANQTIVSRPFTFSYLPDQQEILMVESISENGQPVPVEVVQHQIGFFPAWGLHDAQLVGAFLAQNTSYTSKKGKLKSE